MKDSITATMLYDLVHCPCRLALDLHGDQSRKDSTSAFVELLWEKGHAFEKEVIENLKQPFTDLSAYPDKEKERRTKQAMERHDALIYGGRIATADLLGRPDILRLHGRGYVAGDIKSGAAMEAVGDLGDRKPKRHYAVQLALYTDILEGLGLSAGRTPFVWDIHGDEVPYDLDAAQGQRKSTSLWEEYETCLTEARRIANKEVQPLPALGGLCKLCHWRTMCRADLLKLNDLTLIHELGRSKRDGMLPYVSTVQALSQIDITTLAAGKKTVIKGIGLGGLQRFQNRARLLTEKDAKPYLVEPVSLPTKETELFFDIETDPMRDICYLHGFVERRGGNHGTEKYVAFFADAPTQEMEERVFADAWSYVQSSRPSAIYYYSHFERTHWRKLQQRYPNVATEADIEEMFASDSSVDLYLDVVKKKTEWPTHDQSIKTLASYLKFNWRDTSPSGADAIEWYHRWIETGDVAIKARILEYNEDDCIGTRVLLDGIRELPVRND